MTRMYIQPSFVDSCSDHGEWSGGNGQYRGDRSVEVVPTFINGRPNVRAFSDEAIAARRAKKAPSVPITDRILPQKRRLNTLYEQMQELERSYRSDEMNIKDYTLYRDIIVAKIQRQEVLYKRAASVKPQREETDEDTAQVQAVFYATNHVSSPHHTSTWVDDLPDSNSLKRPIKIVCTIVKGLVKWHNRTKAYIQTLKEV